VNNWAIGRLVLAVRNLEYVPRCGELQWSFVMEPGWRLTWEDSEEDYVYCDGTGRQLGRAYYSPQNQWRWFFAGMTGRTDSRREALLAVEQAYQARIDSLSP
jgi:hypothetical protein